MTNKPCKDCTDPVATPPGPRCAPCHTIKADRDAVKSWEYSIKSKYGLTPEQYWAMYREQGGKCALCQVATGKRKRLAVDHDHKTGLVRGLACGPCNKAIIGEWSRDNPEYFRRGYIHLTNGAAKRLGIEARSPKK